ncbi:HAD family hydrolase [Noviherbaspirillum massiliense]|uniref:HAD family hydrolase n=1 Tax=Noviherbaspirillum massiliense TaxID=1465823 RepID=UPI000309B14A|nr:HAD family phosphatase [Noviherbaspirillum massiliense]
MARFDLVAFDCDGVLVDTELITCGVLADMLNEVGWQVSLEETMRLFVGRLVRDEVPMIKRHATRPVPEDFYLQFVARRNAALEQGVAPVRNVGAAIETLSARGMPFCVVSGADRAKMRLTLGQTGLLRWFEGKLFSGMEVARTKPAPDVYLLAAETMGVDPKRCAVVEDTPTGVAAGVAAGMIVFGYAERMAPQALLDAGAVQVFDDMAQLPELVL